MASIKKVKDETAQGRKWVVFLLLKLIVAFLVLGIHLPNSGVWSLGMMRACAERLVFLGPAGSHSPHAVKTN